MPKSIVQLKRNQGFGAQTRIIIIIIIRRHNRICLGACAVIVANTGKAENHRSIEIQKKEIQKKEIEPSIFELAIGTLKIESGVCDLPRRGSEKSSLIDLSKF